MISLNGRFWQMLRMRDSEQISGRVWDWKSLIFMDTFVGIRSVLSLSKSLFEKIGVDFIVLVGNYRCFWEIIMIIGLKMSMAEMYRLKYNICIHSLHGLQMTGREENRSFIGIVSLSYIPTQPLHTPPHPIPTQSLAHQNFPEPFGFLFRPPATTFPFRPPRKARCFLLPLPSQALLPHLLKSLRPLPLPLPFLPRDYLSPHLPVGFQPISTPENTERVGLSGPRVVWLCWAVRCGGGGNGTRATPTGKRGWWWCVCAVGCWALGASLDRHDGGCGGGGVTG
jgi:hypothetical protein